MNKDLHAVAAVYDRRTCPAQKGGDRPPRPRVRSVCRVSFSAFTLLEILMAMALFAIVAAAAAPLLIDAFSGSRIDEASRVTEEAAMTGHAEAVAFGQRRMLQITSRGLAPGEPLPEGWTLEVQRMTESRYRKPREGETWEFNSAGICEPLSLRLKGDDQSLEMTFDPLTGQALNE